MKITFLTQYNQSPIMFSEEDITCPITHEIFIDPVILEGDGYTYERTAIERWLGSNSTSPSTGAAIKRNGLIPNYLVRQLADRATGCNNAHAPPLRNNLFPTRQEDSMETCTVVINQSSDTNRQEETLSHGNLPSKVKNIILYLAVIVLLIIIMVQSKVLTIDNEGLHIGNKKSNSPSYLDLPPPTPEQPVPPSPDRMSPSPSPSPESTYSPPLPEEWNYSPPLPEEWNYSPLPENYSPPLPEEWHSPPSPNPELYNDTYHIEDPMDPMQCYHTCHSCDGAGQYDCLTCAPDFPHFILNLPPHLSADPEFTVNRGENNGRGGCFECIEDTHCFDTRTCRENRCVDWYSDNIQN